MQPTKLTSLCRYFRQQQQTYRFFCIKPRMKPLNASHDYLAIIELVERRQRLFESLCIHSPIHTCQIALFPAATTLFSTYEVPFPFRQNTEFLYLTGFHEPDSVLLIHSTKESLQHKSVLFVPSRNAHKELWEGPKATTTSALNVTGVDLAEEIDHFPVYMRHLIQDFGSTNNCQLWLDFARFPTGPLTGHPFTHVLVDFLRSQPDDFTAKSPTEHLHAIRWVKSEAEICRAKAACRIGAEALKETMRFSAALLREDKAGRSVEQMGVDENVLCAKMDLEARRRGARCLAYPPVIAGGARANIIHYLNNDQLIEPDELVLMDAGCVYQDYVSDITRTWPVCGKYSREQRLLYEIVYEVHRDLLKTLVESRPISLKDLYLEMIARLGFYLQSSGILSSKLTEEELVEIVDQLCPHHVSHYLGIDVHDCHLVARDIAVPPGVIITVEPGLYIKPNELRVAEKFRGIGIRIEDDVLITESGIDVLSEACPKSLNDIEDLLLTQS